MKNKLFRYTALILTIIIVMGTGGSYAKNITKSDVVYETITSKTITSGLVYEKKSKLTTYGWVDIHVLKMDLTNPNVDLDILRSDEAFGVKEPLSELAKGDPAVVGGVNASFFDMNRNPSDIIGTEFEFEYSFAKLYYNTSSKGAANLIQMDTGVLIDFLGISSISFKNWEGRELYISGFNQLSDLTSPVIFNRAAVQNTGQADYRAKLYKIVVGSNGIITDIIAPGTVATIPEGGYVVTVPESIASIHLPYFQPGVGVTLDVTSTVDTENMKRAISGGGLILKNGSVVSPSSMVVEPNNRHPRTAVGVTSDGKYLIAMVIDGRGTSIGATHQETATYLLEYGVSDAMHFDGGGSSEMVMRQPGATTNTIVNKPSGGSERKIVNGMGFVTTAPQGTIEGLTLTASATAVYLNTPIKMSVTAHDNYYNPYPIDMSEVVWGNEGISGTWSGQTFTPTTAGKGKITCTYQGVTTSLDIVSVSELIDLELSPQVLSLDLGQSAAFNLIGTDINGNRVQPSSSSAVYSLENPAIGSFVDGKFVASGQAGISKVTVMVGNREAVGYISVGGTKSNLTSFENVKVTPMSYPSTVVTSASLTSEQVMDGKQSVKLTYQFGASQATQASYAAFEGLTMSKKVTRIGVNVYGNNSGMLLKGIVTDAKGNIHYISFTDSINFSGWKYLEATVPANIAYPIQLSRIYVATLTSDKTVSGTIYLDLVQKTEAYDTSKLVLATDNFMDDPLRVDAPLDAEMKITAFGTTSGKNRLLDDVVFEKVYQNMSNSDIALFAGYQSIDTSKLTAKSIVWNNYYTITDYAGVRIITLATGKGGLMASNASQWSALWKALDTTTQKNIIFVANADPLDSSGFKDTREGQLFHDNLKQYQAKTGKNIFYLNASGYQFDIDLKDGIRYIDMNGLWYNVDKNKTLDLNHSFYTVHFYINGDTLNYSVENLFPEQ